MVLLNNFKTDHNLDFEAAPWPGNMDINPWMCFRVGTCEGLWRSTETSYQILAITNQEPGNGHLVDTMQWFENSSKRDAKALEILEIWNDVFKRHLIQKYNFTELDFGYGPNCLRKEF